MRTCSIWTATFMFAVSAFGDPISSQDRGALETFGTDGRLFSAGKEDYYLLSRQSYVSEDSSGYEGQVRVVMHYQADAYEIRLKDYLARCRSYDGMMDVVWFKPEEREQGTGYTVAIQKPDKRPGADKKESYNLYWAACNGKFLKFK
jgi:hypothetical protein